MKQLVLIAVFALSLTVTLASSSAADDDKELAQKFARVFKYIIVPLKPERTLEYLKRLDELLAGRDDEESEDRRQTIQKLIGHNYDIGQECDLDAAERLSTSINYHETKRGLNGASIIRYLKSLRDKTFELCQEEIVRSVNVAALSLKDGSVSSGRVLRLKELFVEEFKDPARYMHPAKRLDPLLLAFMDEQAGARLSAKSLSRQQFDEQFKVVTDTCNNILTEFELFKKLDGIVTRNKLKQMDKTVVDWFIARYICIEFSWMPALADRKRDKVYALLVARG